MILVVDTRFDNEDDKIFIKQIFIRLAKAHPQNSFVFISDTEFNNPAENIIPVIIDRADKKFLLPLWFDYQISSLLKKYKANAFITPRCLMHTKVPQCLISFKKPKTKWLNKAKLIITKSEFFKKNIIEKYKIDNNKIEVVHSAADEIFKPIFFEEREKIKEEFANANEYFLFTQTSFIKKNFLNLLKAFSIFKKRQKSSMQLIIKTKNGIKDEFLTQLSSFKFKNDVKILSNIHNKEFAKITAGAYVILSDFYFDDAGISLFQAMQCNVPLIIANSAASHEICASAALYADLNNPETIADKMMLVYKDENLRRELIEKGNQQIKIFNWEISANQMWNCILKTVG